MRNSYCLACGTPLSPTIENLYCENHRQMAGRALARIAWGGGMIPRMIVLLLLLGIVIATSL